MIFVFLWALLSLFFLCGALVERYYLSWPLDLAEYEVDYSAWDDKNMWNGVIVSRSRRGDLADTDLTVKQVHEEMGSVPSDSETFAREWAAAVERLLGEATS